LNGLPQFKTGNVFVTEHLPKYTISCFFTACSGEKNNEVITSSSDTYVVLPVLAFLVLSLETSELYESVASRDNGIASVVKNAPDAEVVDLSAE